MSSTNRGTIRNERDYYSTPEHAFKPLLSLLKPTHRYWEPCCGDGRIIKWMVQAGFLCDGADLEPQDPSFPIQDFLTDFTKREFIITNPPFGIAQEFCDHALSHSANVMMLLRLNFLGAQKRADWWRMHEPNALFILSKRPDFTGGGGDSTEYAWFSWGNDFKGIHHL